MPHIRNQNKVGGAEEKKKKVLSESVTPRSESKRQSDEEKYVKTDEKTFLKIASSKENVPRSDSCFRNGIIRFPLIPGVTLKKKKSGKNAKIEKVVEEEKDKDTDAELLKEKHVKFAPSHTDDEPVKNVSSSKKESKNFYPLFKGNLGLLPELVVPQVPEITALVPEDPISACLPCLEANGTYICTPWNPRCYIIQKVTTSPTGSAAAAAAATASTTASLPQSTTALNPEAVVFESGSQEAENSFGQGCVVDTPQSEINDSSWLSTSSDYIVSEGYAYMNGDVGKLPSGAVYSTPEPMVPATDTDYSSLNGVGESVEHYDGGGGADASPADATAPTSPPPATPEAAATIPLEQLKQMLSSQLEYYFSRENLANDTYLLSQMDNDQYVPIWTVANFNQVKKLTTDIKLITQVLRESPNVQVDEEGQKVRPNHKRCIVILREIPDSTPLEEVKDLFSGDGCPKLISCEFAHNNSWYVTFESDEDAQRAYRFLREEVKEFQGKPIMARIKAKPMNRLPIPPVGGAGMSGMKNGYRTPPGAVFDPATGPFQPAGPTPGPQQRFIYSNGSSIPAVNYSNQPLHVYTFPQTNQPFYPPPMLQPWGAANTFFDIGSVFSVNGLAPQQSFPKPASNRFVPRTSRNNKRPSSERGGSSESPTLRLHHVAPVTLAVSTPVAVATPVSVVAKSSGTQSNVKVQTSQSGDSQVKDIDSVTIRLSDSSDAGFRPPKEKTDSGAVANLGNDRPRRRRKDEEGGSLTGRSTSPASQFDLEDSAFPPLPAGAVLKTVSVETETVAQSHWGENRLADVVKGTVKHKTSISSSSGTLKEDGRSVSPPVATSPAPPLSTSPKPFATTSMISEQVAIQGEQSAEKPWKSVEGSSPPASAANSSCDANATILTPPPSPIKCAVPVPKCATADKATKTDDTLLNGEVERSESSGAKPATTNAATMTSSVALETDISAIIPVSSDVPPRLSYAQVAQHAKDKGERPPREKTSSESDKDRKKEGSCSRESKGTDKDKRDEGFREVAGRGAGRAGSRSTVSGERESRGPRRRDVAPRPLRDAK